MAENASSSANGNHNEPPPDSDAMLDAKEARRHRKKLQRRGEWKCSWGKTRSATESDSEDEEKNREGVEDEESSDDSMKRDERAKEEKRKKRKRPLNVDSDGEDIPGLDLDGDPVFSDGEIVVCSEAEDEEEETEDVDIQGPYTSSDNDDGTGAYYEDDELNYSSNSDGDSW
ncbi:general transcription factor IIF subunit 1-like [Papaver somniferum]|uniref:general transcription factor IIF subunit 1-like n=1 Tax=Papaver somniferum TaxID=3469 RepID=UPI000E6FF261|nr:general transcription factor IIF subunit 1-like [Papaver somniferum]